MDQEFKKLNGTNDSGKVTAVLDGSNGNLTLGGHGSQGDITLLHTEGKQTIHLDGGEGNILLGGNGSQGDIGMLNADGQQTIHLDGGNGNLTMGGNGSQGDITLLHTEGAQTIHIDGGNGNMTMGGGGSQGDLALLDGDGKQTIHLDGGSGDITLNGRKLQPADFVFEPDYVLPELESVDRFIKENGHLPDLPSGDTMKNEGLSLANFNMLLLQKVEELTLYVIQQEKQIRELREEMNRLQ